MECLTKLLVLCFLGMASCEPVWRSYGPPPKEETEVEIQKVEVYEVPWIGDQQAETNNVPPSQYGPPSPSYGPPPQEVVPPDEVSITTEYPSTTTTILQDNATNSAENKTEKLQISSEKLTEGQYYIYHPTGLLQKVSYITKDDGRNMAFSAQLKYKNVDPVRGPIYTYDPNTFVFSRLNRK
ncbi:hypothetical protein HUJ04_004197 [Dendroctonus ponderosae]|uniref:DUF4794 domain-containing protein n=1 Tax=Dendroctonus ponderosae TaxID=77166 RepID=A0AAR5P7A1_DENPD|nr:hypothetical protein HUJ04_004197 [Dendroctonus ponderosae]